MSLSKLPIKYRLTGLTTILILVIFLVFYLTVMLITYLYQEKNLTARLREELVELEGLGITHSAFAIYDHPELIREIREIYRNQSISIRFYSGSSLLYQYGVTDLQTLAFLDKNFHSKQRESIKSISVLGSYFKTLTVRLTAPRPLTVELWILKSEINPYLSDMAVLTALALLVVFVISIPLTLRFSRSISDPIERLNREISRIYSDNLNQEITFYPSAGDEIGQLIMTINALNQRLHASFEDLRQFSSHLSHEIRTPLSQMLTLLPQVRDEQLREQFHRKIFRIITMLESIKLLHVLKEGIYPLERSVLDLRYLVDTLSPELLEPSRMHLIRAEIPDMAKVEVDETLFLIALKNILENACRYDDTGDGVLITFQDRKLQVINGASDQNRCRLQQLLDPPDSVPTAYRHIGLRLVRAILTAHELPYTFQIDGSQVIFSLHFPELSI